MTQANKKINKITELDERGKQVKFCMTSKQGNTYNMTAYEMSRWCAMLDAVEIIDKKLHYLKLEKSNDWVKPIAIQKYVDEKYQDILHEMIS